MRGSIWPAARRALLCWLAAAGVARGEPVGFEGLAPLPGYERSSAFDVSGDGRVGVGYSAWRSTDADPGGWQATSWIAGGATIGLGFLPGHDGSSAFGVAELGSVVVGTSENRLDGGKEAFRWTEAGGMVGLGFLPGADSSEASGVSADGSVVVGYSGGEAFRWTQAAGMVGLGFLPGADSSRAFGVSGDGSVVVGFCSRGWPFGGEAFRWTQAGGMVGLGFLAMFNLSSALGVSTDGSTVVGWNMDTTVPHWYPVVGFRWTQAEGMLSLGVPLNDYTAYAVSANGSTVVGMNRTTWDPPPLPPAGAFVWDSPNGMRNLQQVLTDQYGLNLTGWELSIARAVSDDGAVIVGGVRDPSGESAGWRAVIPEPSTGALAAIAVAALWLLAWMREHRHARQ